MSVSQERLVPFLLHPTTTTSTGEVSKRATHPQRRPCPSHTHALYISRYRLHGSLLFFSSCFSSLLVRVPVCNLPFSSLLLSKANSTSTGQLDKLVSAGLSGLSPESEEERCLPPQRVSTFRPRPYSMADSNKVRSQKEMRISVKCGKCPYIFSPLHPRSPQTCPLLHHLQPGNFRELRV